MKCPMMKKKALLEREELGCNPMHGTELKDEFCDCIEDECAWWYSKNKVCSIRVIAQGAGGIIVKEGR